MQTFKIIIKNLGMGTSPAPWDLKGVVVGQGNTCEEVIADVRSALIFIVETFGPEMLKIDPPILEAFVAETAIEISDEVSG